MQLEPVRLLLVNFDPPHRDVQRAAQPRKGSDVTVPMHETSHAMAKMFYLLFWSFVLLFFKSNNISKSNVSNKSIKSFHSEIAKRK